MSKTLLTSLQIVRELANVRTAYRNVQEPHDSPGGTLIQFPKIPSLLSESMIAFEVETGASPLGTGRYRVLRGGSESDLLVKGTNTRIQVKGTGRQGFQNLSEKDLTADVLVWVNFGPYFESDDGGEIRGYWVEDPSQHLSKAGKISLDRFQTSCHSALQTWVISVERLAAFAGLEIETSRRSGT